MQGTEADTDHPPAPPPDAPLERPRRPSRRRDIFRHSALLFSTGDRLHCYAFDAVYPLAGVRLTGSSTAMITPLHGAKNWQLPRRLARCTPAGAAAPPQLDGPAVER